MSSTSKIEWTDATWNPVTGCEKVSQGCKHCYAERLWPKLEGARVTREGGESRPFTDVQMHRDRLDQPLHLAKPRMIFVNSISDLFHPRVTWEFLDAVFGVMAVTTRHTYQILTKRPERMRAYMERLQGECENRLHLFPARISHRAAEFLGRGSDNCGPRWPLENVWLGVSVEDQATAKERISLLLQTPAAVRWISAEPLLGPIDLHLDKGWCRYCKKLTDGSIEGHCMDPNSPCFSAEMFMQDAINWVVTGGESGPNARPPHPDWFRNLRDQCKAAGVPFFFKQWGQWVSVSEVEGPGAHHYFPDGVTVRRTGKKLAGRQLDGVEHNEYPASPSTTTKEPQ